MQVPGAVSQPLDAVASLARSGDSGAETAMLQDLRVRFLAIAKRRVRADDAEDVVQDSLSIVLAKYKGRESATGLLGWSMVVLRNVIGNYYMKSRRKPAGEPYDEKIHGGRPPYGLDSSRIPHADGAAWSLEDVAEAIDRLARGEPRCGLLFRRIVDALAEGGSSREILSRAIEGARVDLPDVSRESLHVALHRCRKHLREILNRMGEGTTSPVRSGERERRGSP